MICVSLVLAMLLAACTSLPPSRPVVDTADLAGTWRGRMSGPMGNAPLILTIGQDGSYGGMLYVEPTYKEIRGTRFVRGGGGSGAEVTPEK